MAVVTSADPSPGVAADAPDLTEVERRLRVCVEHFDEDAPPRHSDLTALLAEYDRRATELARVRAAVTALADELDGMAPARMSSPDVAARLRETLGHQP